MILCLSRIVLHEGRGRLSPVTPVWRPDGVLMRLGYRGKNRIEKIGSPEAAFLSIQQSRACITASSVDLRRCAAIGMTRPVRAATLCRGGWGMLLPFRQLR